MMWKVARSFAKIPQSFRVLRYVKLIEDCETPDFGPSNIGTKKSRASKVLIFCEKLDTIT